MKVRDLEERRESELRGQSRIQEGTIGMQEEQNQLIAQLSLIREEKDFLNQHLTQIKVLLHRAPPRY